MSNSNLGVNDHTFQGRKKKLSVWVKKIIQPAKESGPTAAASSSTDDMDLNHTQRLPTATQNSSSGSFSSLFSPSSTPKASGDIRRSNNYDHKEMRHRDQDKDLDYSENNEEIESTSQISTRAIRELSPARTDSLSMKVLWGDEPKRTRPEAEADLLIPTRDDESDSTDNVSIQALFSMCSSSFKSSTFSDVHSLQSTRATVVSGRTTETNSSTAAIPPASILDRARHGGSSAANSTTTNLGSPTPSLHHSHSHSHHPRHISRPSSVRQMPLQREREPNTTTTAIK